MEKIVKTINNLDVPEEKCRFINGKYYLIGDINIENSGDVFLINDRYVRLETGRLIFNLTTSSYELISQTNAIEGFVYYDEKNNKFIKGYFEFNPLYDSMIYYLNEDLTVQKIHLYFRCYVPLSYREDIKTGNYHHISKVKAIELNKINNVTKQFKESFPYNSTKENMKKTIQNFEYYYKPLFNNNIQNLSLLFKDLTFGLEFETTNGIIPSSKLNCLPLLPLRDGSINGLEYVTIPLQGVKGLQAVVDSAIELNKRTTTDSSCSLHIHFGNIPRTPSFILALFKLYNIFSNEIYKMFPYYKYDNLNIKRKNYSEPYDLINLLVRMDNKITTTEQINNNFGILFDYLAESKNTGVTFKSINNDLNNITNHPRDPKNEAKWNIHHRYHVLNFIPLIFVNKATVEFRIHTATTDPNKIIYFMIMCSALINEAIVNEKLILNDFNKYISNNYFSNRSFENFLIRFIEKSNIKSKSRIIDELLNYISYRKQISKNFFMNGDFKYEEKNIIGNFNINLESKITSYSNNILNTYKSYLQESNLTSFDNFFTQFNLDTEDGGIVDVEDINLENLNL